MIKLKDARDFPLIDMSAKAIERRLREFFDLWQMAQKLKSARLIGPVNNADKVSPESH